MLRGSATFGGTYYLADNNGLLASGWVVTSDIGSYGLQRYWFVGGTYVKDRLISSDEAGYWAYATPSGYVVRGKYTDPSTGYVYLADNDGRLAGPGWAIGAYVDGLQRYWVDATAHGPCKTVRAISGKEGARRPNQRHLQVSRDCERGSSGARFCQP